jgi:hypothetical protein
MCKVEHDIWGILGPRIRAWVRGWSLWEQSLSSDYCPEATEAIEATPPSGIQKWHSQRENETFRTWVNDVSELRSGDEICGKLLLKAPLGRRRS